jgi:ABC-2 type transport system ATP-binding protein
VSEPAAPAIVVAGLEKHYGAVHAVDGVSFTVERGEVFGLLGPNGAGKTTTIEILEGYRTPDAGTARVLGLDPWSDATRLRARVGVMLQEGGLHPGLRVREVAHLYAAFYDASDDPDELVARVGLAGARSRMVRRLSGGERQRLSLACALIGRPELAFLDEPTAGMDPQARATTWDLVRAASERGATVVLTTHLLDEAERLCDRLAIIAGGRLAAIGTPGELTAATDRPSLRIVTARPLPAAPLAAALSLPPDAILESRPCEYVVQRPSTPAMIADLTAFLRDHDVELVALAAARRSLEEVFLQITAEHDTERVP